MVRSFDLGIVWITSIDFMFPLVPYFRYEQRLREGGVVCSVGVLVVEDYEPVPCVTNPCLWV
jgi:hypothetical protein